MSRAASSPNEEIGRLSCRKRPSWPARRSPTRLVLAQRSQITWVMSVLFGYTAFAAAHGVNLAFAGFVAGFRSTERNHYRLSLDSISTVAAGVFVPVYFAIIGFKLDFTKTFSPLMLTASLVGSSVVHMLCLSMAARAAGFR